ESTEIENQGRLLATRPNLYRVRSKPERNTRAAQRHHARLPWAVHHSVLQVLKPDGILGVAKHEKMMLHEDCQDQLNAGKKQQTPSQRSTPKNSPLAKARTDPQDEPLLRPRPCRTTVLGWSPRRSPAEVQSWKEEMIPLSVLAARGVGCSPAAAHRLAWFGGPATPGFRAGSSPH